jgi:hypothetical protein
MQAWAYGDSLRDYIIAFFVLAPEKLNPWAESKNLEVNEDILKN